MNAEKQNPANMITTTAAVIPSCHFERRVVASDLPFEVSAGDEYGLSIFESDNVCVNRDAATRTGVGLVESDIMGACDHPTIDRPQRFHGFGSTLCYPDN